MGEHQFMAAAAQIKLLLTDVDGVLTDNGVYYSETGEVMKRFSIRDGMGVERLRRLGSIETGIVTGEFSSSVTRRAEKLAIQELHLGVKDKLKKLSEIMERLGIAGCPADAMGPVRAVTHYTCAQKGGDGAFREFAEWILHLKHLNI